MPILRVFLTKVDATRDLDAEVEETVNVSTNSSMSGIKIEKAGNADVVRVSFKLSTIYEPNIGRIDLEGVMYYGGEPLKDILSDPKAKKLALLPDKAKEIHQAILRIPIVVSVNIARELNLPMPINFPKVELVEKAKGG